MSNPVQLSVLATFDDLHRCASILGSAACESEWLRSTDYLALLIQERDEATAECRRLQDVLTRSHETAASSENKLAHARKLVDQERKLRKSAEAARDALERQLSLVREILLSDNRNKLADETKEKLAFLNSRRSSGNGQARYSDARLDTITELDATGMLLGDMSYSRSEDDLDASLHTGKSWKKHVSSVPDDCVSPKRRRSSRRRSTEVKRIDVTTADRLVATTTVTVDHTGNTKASSKIETGSPDDTPRRQYKPSAPPISDSTSDSSEKLAPLRPSKTPLGLSNEGSPGFGIGRKTLSNRQHSFHRRISMLPDPCNYCKERLKFGKMMSKCQNCCAECHPECEGMLPLPCVSVGNTQAVRGIKGTIADYTPLTSPMVPALVVHCIQEVESRGLGEVGIYRVPGSERDVKSLKKSFLRGKGVPNLSSVDIHVVCGTLKDFLRSLREPLILRTYWHDFVQATEIADPDDARAALYQAISELPQPNRDTLAALILHLQHVADCTECKMPTSNLAKIFGPTIVGYSSSELEPQKMLMETVKQSEVVEMLLKLPSDYWANFAFPCNDQENMLRTPSSTSVIPGARSVGTTPRSIRGKRKFFPTPPMFR